MKIVSGIGFQFLSILLLASSAHAVTMQEAKEAIKNVDSLDKAHAFLARHPDTIYKKALSQKELYALSEWECTDSDGNQSSEAHEYNDRGYPASNKYTWSSYGQMIRSNEGNFEIDYTYNDDGFLVKKSGRKLETGTDSLLVSYVESYSRDSSNQIQSKVYSSVQTSGKKYENKYKYEHRPFHDEYCEIKKDKSIFDDNGIDDKTCYYKNIDKRNFELVWRSSSQSGEDIHQEVNKHVYKYDQYGSLTLYEVRKLIGSRKIKSTGEYNWRESVVFHAKCSNEYKKRKFQFWKENQ